MYVKMLSRLILVTGLCLVVVMGACAATITGTYVNATTSNTTAAVSPWYIDAYFNPDGLWTRYNGWVGEPGYVYFAIYDKETTPILTETVTGLAEGTYQVYVIYWACMSPYTISQSSQIKARISGDGGWVMCDEYTGTATTDILSTYKWQQRQVYLGTITGTSYSIDVMQYGNSLFTGTGTVNMLSAFAGTAYDTGAAPAISKVEYNDDITVDGNVGEWAVAEWKLFTSVYDSDPVDILDGSAWAAKWGAGGTKIYVALKVKDSDHVFTNSYVDWAASDRTEIYVNAGGGSYGPYGKNDYDHFQEMTQEWAVGIDGSDVTHSSVWVTNGYAPLFGPYVPTGSEITAGGHEGTGDDTGWIFYEAEISPLEYFGGRRGNPDVGTVLFARQSLKFDCDVVGNNGLGVPSSYGIPGYTGMKTTHPGNNWSGNYVPIDTPYLVRVGVQGIVTLQGHSGSLLGIDGVAKVKDASGNVVETHRIVLDAIGLYTFQTGLRGDYTVEIEMDGYAAHSQSVTIDADGNASADFALGNNSPSVGANNKAVLDAIMTTAASKYKWVLWGKVSEATASSFKIDDGSGVVITVNGANTLQDGDYVSVKGSLDAEKTLTAQEIVKHNE